MSLEEVPCSYQHHPQSKDPSMEPVRRSDLKSIDGRQQLATSMRRWLKTIVLPYRDWITSSSMMAQSLVVTLEELLGPMAAGSD